MSDFIFTHLFFLGLTVAMQVVQVLLILVICRKVSGQFEKKKMKLAKNA